MLCVVPEDDWTQHMLAARDGSFLKNNQLLEHEKALLSVLLAPDAADRPSEIQDVIDVAEILLDNYKGKSLEESRF